MKLTSGPTAATRLRLLHDAPLGGVHLLLVITHHAKVGFPAQALAHAPFQRVSLSGNEMRVALFGAELVTVQRRHRPGLFLVNIPSGPGGLHEGPKARANARGGRGGGIARGRPNAAAEREVELLEMPRQCPLAKKVANTAGGAVKSPGLHMLIHQRKQHVHAKVPAENLCVRDPNHTGNVGVGEDIGVGDMSIVAGRGVELIGPVEIIVVAEINPWRRQRCAIEAF